MQFLKWQRWLCIRIVSNQIFGLYKVVNGNTQTGPLIYRNICTMDRVGIDKKNPFSRNKIVGCLLNSWGHWMTTVTHQWWEAWRQPYQQNPTAAQGTMWSEEKMRSWIMTENKYCSLGSYLDGLTLLVSSWTVPSLGMYDCLSGSFCRGAKEHRWWYCR